MANWNMTCTCGDTLQGEGDSAEAAVDSVMATIMTPDGIAQHMADKHPGDPVPTSEQSLDMLLASATAA